MTFLKVQKELRKGGYVVDHISGSHVKFRHKETGRTVTVPKHSGKDLSPGVIADLKRKTGLSFR